MTPRTLTPRMSCPDEQDLLSKLVDANHILDYYNLTDAFGHIAVRSPDGKAATFHMTGKASPNAVQNLEDLATYMIIDGSVAEGAEDRSPTSIYSERFCHSEVMKLYPGVQATVHSHSPELVAVGTTRTTMMPLYHMAGFLGGETQSRPCFDIADDAYDIDHTFAGDRNMLVNSCRLGSALASAFSVNATGSRSLPERTVLLQRGHGFMTWGTSIEEAVYRAVYAQENAKILIMARQLAAENCHIRGLNAEELAACRELDDASVFKSWEYFVQKVRSSGRYVNRFKDSL